MIAEVEANTDPLGRVRIGGALTSVLGLLPRRDCIRLVSAFIRRGLPLLQGDDPHARVARCVVDLCDALAEIDDAGADDDGKALALPLDSLEGPWVANLGRAVWHLWRATVCRSGSKRGRQAATALVNANMTIAGMAWAAERAYPLTHGPLTLGGSEVYHMLFHPAYADPWKAGWAELCADLRTLQPLATAPSAPVAAGGEPK